VREQTPGCMMGWDEALQLLADASCRHLLTDPLSDCLDSFGQSPDWLTD